MFKEKPYVFLILNQMKSPRELLTSARLEHTPCARSMELSLDWQLENSTDSTFISMETYCRVVSQLALTIILSHTLMLAPRICQDMLAISVMCRQTTKATESITFLITRSIFMDLTLLLDAHAYFTDWLMILDWAEMKNHLRLETLVQESPVESSVLRLINEQYLCKTSRYFLNTS